MAATAPVTPARIGPRQVAVAGLVVLVVLVMLLTSGQVAGMRAALPLLSRVMSWLDRLPVPLDMDHVAFFACVGAALRLLLPRTHWWRLLMVLVVLAVGTELSQFFTIGRTPKLLDARDDMIGAGVGLLLAALPLALFERLRRSPDATSIGDAEESPSDTSD